MLNRSASNAIQQALLKPCLVNLTLKDIHLVFSMTDTLLISLLEKVMVSNGFFIHFVLTYICALSVCMCVCVSRRMPRTIFTQGVTLAAITAVEKFTLLCRFKSKSMEREIIVNVIGSQCLVGCVPRITTIQGITLTAITAAETLT